MQSYDTNINMMKCPQHCGLIFFFFSVNAKHGEKTADIFTSFTGRTNIFLQVILIFNLRPIAMYQLACAEFVLYI